MKDTFSAHETTRKKRRWGCTCGCLVFILVLLLGFIGSIYYVLRSFPAVARDRWMKPSMDGFAVIRLNSDDPGISSMLNVNIQRFEKLEKPRLSEKDQKALSAMLAAMKQFIGGLMRPEIPLYFTYDRNTERENVLGVLQFRNMMSYLMVKTLMNAAVKAPPELRDSTQLYIGKNEKGTSEIVVALSDRTFAYTNDPEMLERVLDEKQNSREGGQASAHLQEYMNYINFEQPPAGEDFAGVWINEPGRLETLLRRMESAAKNPGYTDELLKAMKAQKLSMSDVLAVRVSGDIQSADRAKVELILHCRQDATKRLAEVLKRAVAELPQEAGEVSLKMEVKSQGSMIIVTVEASGLKAWTGQLFRGGSQKESPSGTAKPPEASLLDKMPWMIHKRSC